MIIFLWTIWRGLETAIDYQSLKTMNGSDKKFHFRSGIALLKKRGCSLTSLSPVTQVSVTVWLPWNLWSLQVKIKARFNLASESEWTTMNCIKDWLITHLIVTHNNVLCNNYGHSPIMICIWSLLQLRIAALNYATLVDYITAWCYLCLLYTSDAADE